LKGDVLTGRGRSCEQIFGAPKTYLKPLRITGIGRMPIPCFAAIIRCCKSTEIHSNRLIPIDLSRDLSSQTIVFSRNSLLNSLLAGKIRPRRVTIDGSNWTAASGRRSSDVGSALRWRRLRLRPDPESVLNNTSFAKRSLMGRKRKTPPPALRPTVGQARTRNMVGVGAHSQGLEKPQTPSAQSQPKARFAGESTHYT
jgi:hypothetical protein